MPLVIPAVDYLELNDEPRLRAHACTACGALYFDRRNACASCSATEFESKRLSSEGVVRAYTIVHRAAPGQTAPYTSVVVDLEGGGVVKANLLDVTDPAAITAGLKVRLATFPVGVDDDGVEAIAFGFEPIGGGL